MHWFHNYCGDLVVYETYAFGYKLLLESDDRNNWTLALCKKNKQTWFKFESPCAKFAKLRAEGIALAVEMKG